MENTEALALWQEAYEQDIKNEEYANRILSDTKEKAMYEAFKSIKISGNSRGGV